jgi:hypothetical protein
MAEEDLGGGMFDEDVINMREYSNKVKVPQVYDADELDTLDEQLALHEAPAKSLMPYKTGTKLYTCQLAETGNGIKVRGRVEIRGPVEQVIGFYMGHCPKYISYKVDNGEETVGGERRNDHNIVAKSVMNMPPPFVHRDVVTRTLWKKMDEDTFFLTQVSYDHRDFPESKDAVRMSFLRSMKLTRTGPKLTLLEWSGELSLNGYIPRNVNDTVVNPRVASTTPLMARYFTCVRPADVFDEGDGTALGQIMHLTLSPHRKNLDVLTEKIFEMIRTTNVLRSAQAKYR